LITNIELKPNADYPPLSRVSLEPNFATTVEVLKRLSYVIFINSPLLKIAELRGRNIVNSLFRYVKWSTLFRSNLLPEDFRKLHEEIDEPRRDRIICDFIAGMTDRYALEFYGRLFSENPQTIFKPL
jgi:dGTPase